MQAMILTWPPQLLQVSISMLNTRLADMAALATPAASVLANLMAGLTPAVKASQLSADGGGLAGKVRLTNKQILDVLYSANVDVKQFNRIASAVLTSPGQFLALVPSGSRLDDERMALDFLQFQLRPLASELQEIALLRFLGNQLNIPVRSVKAACYLIPRVCRGIAKFIFEKSVDQAAAALERDDGAPPSDDAVVGFLIEQALLQHAGNSITQ